MGSVGMGITDEYAWTAVILSLVSILLAGVNGYRVARSYRIYHDERAAVSLAKGVGLFVIAAGMLISSWGLIVESASFSVAGLSVARGAFISLMATLVLADVRAEGGKA